jgi:hypothetical protein
MMIVGGWLFSVGEPWPLEMWKSLSEIHGQFFPCPGPIEAIVGL